MKFANKDNAEKYIKNFIIPEIQVFLQEDTPSDGNRRSELYMIIKEITRDGHSHILHNSMLPYIERYFYARDGVFDEDYRIKRLLIENIIECDTFFGSWASRQDILEATDEWGKSLLTTLSGAWHFLWMMECMLATGYMADWKVLAKKVCDRLMKEEVYGNYKSSEVYSMLYGVSMIFSSKQLTEVQKNDMLNLLKNRWDFFKNIYSVMFRCVVGYRFTNMAQVANTITLSKDNYPHLHLFHCALKGCIDDFCKKKGDRAKLEKQLKRIENLMESTTSSSELEELYRILFPDEFQYYLNTHRHKNYKQLEAEYELFKQEMNMRMGEMNLQISGMAEQLKAMASSSVPISVIADELLQLSPGIAWEVFIQLNGMLIENEAWIKSVGEIRKKIRIKIQQESNPIIQTTNYYESGANHNDHQKHLHITNDKNKLE